MAATPPKREPLAPLSCNAAAHTPPTAAAARPRAPAVSAEKENLGAANLGPGKEEKKAAPAAAKAPPLKPSSLQARMEGEEAPLARATAAGMPVFVGPRGRELLPPPPPPPVSSSYEAWDLSDNEAAPAASWATLPNRALLCRPLPLDVGRCTCVVVREKATGARGVALYSLYTNEGQGRQDRKLAVARHRRRRGRSEFIVAQNQDGVFGSSDKNFLGTMGANLVGSRYQIWGQGNRADELKSQSKRLLGIIAFAPTIATLTGTGEGTAHAEMLRGSLRWLLVLAVVVAASAGKAGRGLHRDFDAVWGKRNARFFDEGRVVELALDRETGSRLQSKDRYLFGRFDLDIRLVAGESAGTITSFYICTGGARHDEVDFEFLGNVSGEPYILHTNIFSDGKGEREQQFVLWFDPTADFHTYSILWNPLNIILYIDGTPIRVFKNNEANGVPFPTRQPVHVFASIWNAEEWATQGGRVKTDWSEAPFVAAYRRFDASSACVWHGGASPTRCGGDHLPSSASSWMGQRLDWWSWMTLNWVRMNYMTYDYCADRKRYPHGFPAECIIPIGRI